MILSFKKQFKEMILNGSKIHTIREDIPNRWREGMKIHFATGVRTSKYNQFKSGICCSVQKISIKYDGGNVPCIHVDGQLLSWEGMKTLAIKDGFEDLKGFLKWFSSDFNGKIIHWTDFKYKPLNP